MQLLRPAEPRDFDDPVERQETLGPNFDRVLARLQLHGTEGRGADHRLVDGNQHIVDGLGQNDEIPRQLAHIQLNRFAWFVPDDETLRDIVVAGLPDLDRVIAPAQQHPLPERQAEPATFDRQAVGFLRAHFEVDRLGAEQQIRDDDEQSDDHAENRAERATPGVFPRSRSRVEGATKRGRCNGLIGRLRLGIGQFRRLGNVGAVLEPNVEGQLAAAGANGDATAVVLQLVAVNEPTACRERVAVKRQRLRATDRLHERRAVEQVDQCDGRTAGSRQANLAVAPGAYAQWQVGGAEATLTLDVPDNKLIETQIASSQRTMIGCMSISGATRNSSLTSR